MPVGPVTHECVACGQTSYCDCPSCFQRRAKGSLFYELVENGQAIKCPHCGYVEGTMAAEERLCSEAKARRNGVR
jgi:hypothetical protein